MTKAFVAVLLFTLIAILVPSPAAIAQTSDTAGRRVSTSDTSNLRFFQQFFNDAAIIDKQWYGIELRLQKGAVPPHESADGFLLTPTIAISPLKNLEVGGTVSYIDYELDNEINAGSLSGFDGESGLGDLTAWGKYRILDQDTTSFTAGGFLDLPTGSEDDGLGTGKVTPGVFAAFRVRAGDGYFLGDAALRFNRDAEVLHASLNGKTSSLLGGGYIWELYEDWGVSGEVTVESERFDGASSDFRATAGIQYLGIAHSYLRGAASVGLSDGAPDFELILGYAYSF